MQIIGGVRQQSPAWETIDFSPRFIGQSAEVTIPSLKGLIHSSWKRVDNQITGQLRLPEGMQAQVNLNGVMKRESGHYHYKLNNIGLDEK